MIDSDDRRSNPAEQGGLLGITASSAALVVAQQGVDFALTTDHLSGARVSCTKQLYQGLLIIVAYLTKVPSMVTVYTLTFAQKQRRLGTASSYEATLQLSCKVC